MDVDVSAATARRQRLSLDGEWQFRHENGEWRTIAVPSVWQAKFADLRLRGGTAIYKRRFSAVPRLEGHEAVLHFEAVNYFTDVHLNGRPLGSHEGGWLPFEFGIDLQDLGEDNELEVRVTLPSGANRSGEQASFAQIPHGKQSWYGPLSGIWQPVWLETRNHIHLRGCRITAELASGQVHAEVNLSKHEDGISINAEI